MPLPGQAIALGTIVEADFAGTDVGGTPTYVAIGLIKGLTPPGRGGTEADGKTLGVTLDVPIPGIEDVARFTFTQYWYPGDAEQAKVDAAFDNRRKPAGADGGVVTIRVLYPHDGVEEGDSMPSEEFQVNIFNIGKDSLDEPNAVYMRTVECTRITDITPGTFVVPAPA